MQHRHTLQRAAIIIFLLCLVFAACRKKTAESTDNVPPSSFVTAPPSVEPLMPVTVARIFERSCKSCHGPAGHGIAAIAPDIHKAPQRTAEQWKQYLTTGHPGATMAPPTWINVNEISVIAGYLANLHAPDTPSPTDTDDAPSSR